MVTTLLFNRSTPPVISDLLDTLRNLLFKLWDAFSNLIEWLLTHVRLVPMQDEQMAFDLLLMTLIKIASAVVLISLLTYGTWMLLNRVANLLKKLVLIAFAVWGVLIALYWLRGLP